MKKFLFLFLLTAFASPAATDPEAILDRIETLNKKTTTISASFVQARTLANKKTVTLDGTLYFADGDKMDIIYSAPEGDRFCFNGNKMRQTAKGATHNYDLTKNASMRSLADCLSWAMTGQVRSIAKANNAKIDVQEEDSHYVITLTATKKQVKGYARLTLTYNKKNGLLERLVMEEFSHVINDYQLHSPKANAKLPATAFAL